MSKKGKGASPRCVGGAPSGVSDRAGLEPALCLLSCDPGAIPIELPIQKELRPMRWRNAHRARSEETRASYLLPTLESDVIDWGLGAARQDLHLYPQPLRGQALLELLATEATHPGSCTRLRGERKAGADVERCAASPPRGLTSYTTPPRGEVPGVEPGPATSFQAHGRDLLYRWALNRAGSSHRSMPIRKLGSRNGNRTRISRLGRPESYLLRLPSS